MKKIVLLVFTALFLVACSDDDDVQVNIQTTKAEILKAELPDSFNLGEFYMIDVYYLLPSACHIDVGLKIDDGATSTEYYLYGVAAYDADQVGCDQTSTDLERSAEFEVFVESQDAYVFHVWRGFDQDGKDIYDRIEVPVNMETPGDTNN